MKKYKKPSIEYSMELSNNLCFNFAHRNLKEALYYNYEFFKPQNYVYRIYQVLSEYNSNATFADFYEEFKKYRTYYKKLWNGEDLTGKTIFVFMYICGYGDYIIFSRYIRLLEKMAKKVIIEVNDNLIDFYRYNFPNCELVVQEPCVQNIKYDYTCHHEHLLMMQKDLDTFPFPEGYLDANPEKIKKFAPLFDTNKLKVGIYHEGRKDVDDRHIRIRKMFPIFENKQCQFYTLNYDKSKPYTKEIHDRYNIIELQPYINNLHDTAALIKNMDLVVSTDAFAPNLSGAMGVKTYMLLHDKPGWRWFDEFYKTDWYNSVRIIRRSPYMTVEEQIDEMAKILEQECAEFYSKKVK